MKAHAITVDALKAHVTKTHATKSHSITAKEVDEAVDELRETARKMIDSMVSVAKKIDWQMVAAVVVPALLLIYGIRNRSVIKGIVASVIAEIIALKPAEHVTIIARDLVNRAGIKN
jgi:hypothetical protein